MKVQNSIEQQTEHHPLTLDSLIDRVQLSTAFRPSLVRELVSVAVSEIRRAGYCPQPESAA